MPCCDEPQDIIDDVRLDRLTRVSCDMRTIIRRNGLEADLSVEARQWIADHDDWDRRRIAEEAALGEREIAKRKALDKLTLDDRRVLGL